MFPQKVEYDAVGYERLGMNLAQGHGFSQSVEPPYEPAVNREPVYPFFISLIYRIFGHNNQAVIVVQVILHAITAVLIYKLALFWFSSRIALVASLLTAIDPTVAGFCGYLSTEPLALFLLVLFTYLFVYFKDNHGLMIAILSGLMLGVLTLCRAVFLLYPLFILVCLLLAPSKINYKKKLAYGLLMILVSLTVLSPWLYRNQRIFNVPFITTRSGHTLLWRAMRTEYTPKEMLIHMVYGASDTFGRKLFPDEYSKMTVRGEFGTDNIYAVGDKKYWVYIEQGYTALEADRLLRKEALQIIKKRPILYAVQSLLELWKLSFFEIVPFAYSDNFNRLMESNRILFYVGTAVRIIMRYIYSWFILILAFIGFLKIRKSFWSYLILIIPIFYVVSTAILVDSGPRYFYPAVPFIFILAALSINKVIEKNIYKTS